MTEGPDPLTGVREGYDRWAAVYDHDANPLPALEEPRVREALGDPSGREVLDLGCGTGRHTAWLVEAGRAGHRGGLLGGDAGKRQGRGSRPGRSASSPTTCTIRCPSRTHRTMRW